MVSRWTRVSAKLPVFPWDTLAEAKATAAAHPGGLVDLSVGTPVDPVPGAADWPRVEAWVRARYIKEA